MLRNRLLLLGPTGLAKKAAAEKIKLAAQAWVIVIHASQPQTARLDDWFSVFADRR